MCSFAKQGTVTAMLASTHLLDHCASESVAAGTVLLRRGELPGEVLYVQQGKVTLGVMGSADALEHQLGVVQGPGWLDATAAVLELPAAMDAVAQTALVVRRLPRAEFSAALKSHAALEHAVLQDVATTHRQQLELTVSRLAKDAEARCAEWLLRNAQTSDKGTCSVQLLQRKRLIAAQLGIAPETLSRVLRHLRERCLITSTGRVVNLLDPVALRALAG
jgi:CRP-like cAMP-binding protein